MVLSTNVTNGRHFDEAVRFSRCVKTECRTVDKAGLAEMLCCGKVSHD